MNSAKSDEPVLGTKTVSIAAVVVTYNRLGLLQECLAALRGQTRQLDEIIVVNNSSTDGTAEWLATQSDLTIVTQPNTGNAGGQYTGIKTAYYKGHDWFWCMDDDTMPTSEALAQFVASNQFADPSTGFLWSLILKPNGEIDQALPTTESLDWWGRVLTDHCIRIDHATFVSVIISRPAVQSVGFPLPWMFIWGEDFEYTRRISGSYKGWAILDSKSVHKAVSKPIMLDPYSDKNFRERTLYRLRNEIVRARVDPLLGRFGKLQVIINTLYQTIRLVWKRKMPLRTFSWIGDGLFRTIQIEYPDGR